MDLDIPPDAVVVGTDDSEPSRRAVRWAAGKARTQGRPLVTLRVHDPWTDEVAVSERRTRVARERASELVGQVRRLHPDLDVHELLAVGEVRRVLLAASAQAHHLVVGSHGRGAVASRVLGSVSTALAAHSTCPVTVVRPHASQSERRGVLVGVDDSEGSVLVLEHAFREASERGLAVVARHCVWDAAAVVTGPHLLDPDDPDAAEERTALDRALGDLQEKFVDVPVSLEVVTGLPEHALPPGSDAMELLVIGRHPHTALDRMLHASVATAVVERALCPVLVVPV